MRNRNVLLSLLIIRTNGCQHAKTYLSLYMKWSLKLERNVALNLSLIDDILIFVRRQKNSSDCLVSLCSSSGECRYPYHRCRCGTIAPVTEVAKACERVARYWVRLW